MNKKILHWLGFSALCFTAVLFVTEFKPLPELVFAQTTATKHMNVTVNGTPINLSWTFPGEVLIIENTDATNAAEVSFDGGVNYFTLLTARSYQFPCSTIRSLYVRRATGVSGNANLNCLVFLKR